MGKKEKWLIAIIIVLVILLLICGIFLIRQKNTTISHKPATTPLPKDESAEAWNGEQDLPQVAHEQDMIAIPGFESMVFSAGEVKQKVNFYNPKSNTCLFTMSLIVNNEELWRSGNVEAGKGFYEIELDHPLEAGTYTGYEHIDCHTPDGIQLNSANVEFTLTVQ